jgi:hypothetical protein
MKKPKLDDYELFYMEITQTDYLNDIELITDEGTEPPSFNKTPTMSNDQVSALALDQLGSLEEQQPLTDADNDQKSLFSKPTSQEQ